MTKTTLTFKKEETTTTHLYACGKCHVVDKHKIIRARIDQKFEVYCRGGGQPELHGYETHRVCPHCGRETLIKYESDCKLGFCGQKNCHYNGGGNVYQCSVCDNRFSYENELEMKLNG